MAKIPDFGNDKLQDALFDLEQQPPAVPFEGLSLDEAVAYVAEQRRQNLKQDAPVESSAAEQKTRRQGGAFGGALKRRIEQTDSNEKLAATNERDIRAVDPQVMKRELFMVSGDQQFRGVILPPKEFSAVTFSAPTLAKRLGNQVLSATKYRDPDARNARKAEVIRIGLESQISKVSTVLSELYGDRQVTRALRKEMRSPGYAHYTGEQMDAMMKRVESIIVKMFEAITMNREANTNRVESLTAALDFRLSGDDYKQTFTYWQQMTDLSTDWTANKINRLELVKAEVLEELSKRS